MSRAPGGGSRGDQLQRAGGRAASADGDRAAAGEGVLTPQILKLAVVVVLGAIMTILDMTIVNVGLATLGRDFGTSIATIQWVSTVYLLAFASVIPLTGWASERFGARPLWLASLGGFMLGSLLAGLSWSIGALIAFRGLQGLAGGMLMPLGQTILAQAAGPRRIGRVMSIVGVPMLLAPIVGPVIGGAIVGATGWRWMFLINLPVGALALLLAAHLLPIVPRRPWERLDTRGLVLLCGGTAIFVYGLAETGRRGRLTDALPPSMLLAGLALVALFAWHALRTAHPLIDVCLFTQRGFATAAATNLVLGVALFGVALLLPLYFQIVRGTSPLQTGLLMIPQGLGAACAITLAGSLGTALLAVVLQTAISSQLPGLHGGIGQAAVLAARQPAQATTPLTDAFTSTFWVAFAFTAAALLPALLLPNGPSSHRAKTRPTPAQPNPRASGRRSRAALAAQQKGHA